MKKIYAIPMFIAVAAMTFASCSQEIDAPVSVGTTKVFIGAQAVDELDTKVALETTDDAIFTPSWQAGDQITLIYSGATQGTTTGTWDATANAFAFDVPEAVASTTGNWEYTVTYGNGATFAAARSQAGNAMNGAFDLMRGTKTVSSSLFGKDGENPLIVSINRQTSILYFHITNRGSGIVEPITKAVLKAADGEVLAATAETSEKGVVTNGNETNTLTLNIADGIDMNDAAGMKLWFNVLPGTYSSLSLEVETASYKFEIDTKSTVESTTLTAGRLTKIVGKAKNNYTLKEGTVEHGENVFDCCDYSPYASGVTVSSPVYPVVDTELKQVGAASLKFAGASTTLVGPFQFKRATPLVCSGFTGEHAALQFWLYTETEISGHTMRIELGTGGAADTDDYEWEYTATLAAGWNKISLPVATKRVNEGTPDPSKGFNFVRLWIEGFEAGTAYSINMDDIRLVKSPYSIIVPKYGTDPSEWTSFQDNHPVFSPDKKHAYVISGDGRSGTRGGYLCAIDLEKGELEWMFDGSHSNGMGVMVNPTNGDIYCSTSATKVYCFKQDGTLRWTISDFRVLGKAGLALNATCDVLLIAGNGVGDGVSNRSMWAINPETGEVYSKVHKDASVSGEQIYCGRAEVAVVKEDASYGYIIVAGNEHIAFVKLDKTTHELSLMYNATTKLNTMGANQPITDICGAAVSPDRKYAFFPNENGYIHVADIATMTYAGAIYNGGGKVGTPVFDAAGNMFTCANKWIYKFTKSEYENTEKFIPLGATTKTDLNFAWLGSTPTDTNNAFNYSIPAVAQSGAVYASIGHDSSNADYGKIIKWDNSSANSVGSIIVPRLSSSGADQGYRACFAMTDGYIVIATKGAYGYIEIIEIDDVIAPNTWGYFGGDPCATKNVKLVYGSY